MTDEKTLYGRAEGAARKISYNVCIILYKILLNDRYNNSI
jgi:hypothetical protein